MNGTEPLLTLIQECENLNLNIFRPDATKIDAIHALSYLAYEERIFFNILLSSLLKNKKGEHSYRPPIIDDKPGILRALQAIGCRVSFYNLARTFCDIPN